ncbi:TetR/AcrR family transcriptional regulator [Eubacteriales bacterium OttesenSCG-928-M02]|nr:TetR/AcrR family transcriptional regulator [Eubacteriales bacterium OttesenSCG-928-M02]
MPKEKSAQPAYTIVKKPRVNSKREPVLQASMRMFCHYGYHGASMAIIAADAGVSKGIINKFFISKENLFALCIRRFVDEIKERIDASGNRADGDYRAHMETVFQLIKEYRPQFRLLVSTLMTPSLEEQAKNGFGADIEELRVLLQIFDKKEKDYLEWNYTCYGMLLTYIMGGNEANYRKASEHFFSCIGI